MSGTPAEEVSGGAGSPARQSGLTSPSPPQPRRLRTRVFSIGVGESTFQQGRSRPAVESQGTGVLPEGSIGGRGGESSLLGQWLDVPLAARRGSRGGGAGVRAAQVRGSPAPQLRYRAPWRTPAGFHARPAWSTRPRPEGAPTARRTEPSPAGKPCEGWSVRSGEGEAKCGQRACAV